MPIEYDRRSGAARWAAQLPREQSLRGAILAAGLGRRLEPLTAHHLPKPLFPLGGRLPIAELWVHRMIDAGITDITMNVCVLAETIKRHFRERTPLGVEVGFVDEETPTGTLGGVAKQVLGQTAKRVVDGEPTPDVRPFAGSTVLVPSGDIVTNFDADMIQRMYEIHRRQGAAVTMVVNPIPLDRRKDFGTVLLDGVEAHDGPLRESGRIVGFHEKDPNSPSNLNNASIYLVEAELLREVDNLRTQARVDVDAPFYDFGKHVFPALLGRLAHAPLAKQYPMHAVRYEGAWFDVGTKRDYLAVNEQYLDGKIHGPASYATTPWGQLGHGVDVDLRRVTIVPPVVIGDQCVIAPGATLGPYAVIGDGWTVEEGAAVAHSVLWGRDATGLEAADTRVTAHTKVRNCIVAGGAIDRDVQDATVRPVDGGIEVLSLDYVPKGPRA
ncbi:MAG: NDP-sugar synthase [Myxococcales bacterium FL481]|nr:MAG: NDP-sugar synthase [Myxococcales bacterium FL481]